MWAAMARLHALTPEVELDLDRFLIGLAHRYADILEAEIRRPSLAIRFVDFAALIDAPDRVAFEAAAFLDLTPRTGTVPPGVDATNRGERARADAEPPPPSVAAAIARVEAAQAAARQAASASASTS
jgi:hypothetical protein